MAGQECASVPSVSPLCPPTPSAARGQGFGAAGWSSQGAEQPALECQASRSPAAARVMAPASSQERPGWLPGERKRLRRPPTPQSSLQKPGRGLLSLGRPPKVLYFLTRDPQKGFSQQPDPSKIHGSFPHLSPQHRPSWLLSSPSRPLPWTLNHTAKDLSQAALPPV